MKLATSSKRTSKRAISKNGEVFTCIAPFVFSLFAIVLQQEAIAVRAIPDDNLAYPMLITLKNGSQGSGFFLNAAQASFLVTARHVIFKQNSDDLLDSELRYFPTPKIPR